MPIDFTIPTYHGDTASSRPDVLRLKDAAQTEIDATRQAPEALVLPLSPGNLPDGVAQTCYARMPRAGVVQSVHFVAATNATGDGTVTGTCAGGGNSLLSAATDLKAGIDDTLKAGALTATAAHLTLAAGALVKAAVAPAGTSGAGLGLTCIVTFVPA